MRLQHYLYDQFPVWARPTNPILRYLLQRAQRRRQGMQRWLCRLLGIGMVGGMVAFSYRAYQGNQNFGVSEQGESALFSVLYLPLLLIQFFTFTAALVLTSNMVSQEQQAGTWEAVKITSHGAEMVIRARWAAVFYQLRWLLVFLLIPRVVFVGQMLVDLTDYQGYHLDLYITGITPEVSLEVAILLLAGLMTAALLLPLVILGLNASIGLLLSTVFKARGTTIVAQTVILLLEALIVLGSMSAGWEVLDAEPVTQLTTDADMTQKLVGLVFLGTTGDQGLRFMNLETYFQAWTDVDYGILTGVLMLGAMLLLALVTNGMLWWSARRAARPLRG